MSNAHGSFVWYELMTTDAGSAKSFYSGLLGWAFSDDSDYAEIKASDGHVGGVLPLTAEMTGAGARPAWIGYIAVDDVDRIAAAVGSAGGRVLMPAHDRENVGRFALLADPQSVPFYAIRPTPPVDRPDATSNAFAADRPMQGHVAWNELSTTEPAAAWRLYGELFGWTKEGEMDMGPLGKYEFIRHGSHMLGAIMPKMPQMPAPAWTYYFRAADIDVGADYVRAQGGMILQEPMEIPGGEFSLVAADPQGAAFGLVGPRA